MDSILIILPQIIQIYFYHQSLYNSQQRMMAMKQFNTFAANSPTLSDYYSPKSASQKFAFPSNTNSRNEISRASVLDPLKFIHSVHEHYNKGYKVDRRVEARDQDSIQEGNQAQSRVSMLLSEVSVPQNPPLEFQPPRLFALENNITQEILELRQQKITLMQELSRVLDTKNLFQHYLLKASNDKEEVQTNQGSFRESPHSNTHKNGHGEEFVPIHISAPILKRNEELHLKLKQLQIKAEIFGPNFHEAQQDHIKNQKLLQEIIKIREMNSNLKDEMASKMKKTETSQSRFVTFQPQDRLKHFDSKPSLQEYHELQQKYKKLQGLGREGVVRLTQEEAEYLQSLKIENRALIQQAERMIQSKRKGNSNIYNLQRQKEENQRQRQMFLEQLQKFKQAMKRVKQENEQLKYELAH